MTVEILKWLVDISQYLPNHDYWVLLSSIRLWNQWAPLVSSWILVSPFCYFIVINMPGWCVSELQGTLGDYNLLVDLLNTDTEQIEIDEEIKVLRETNKEEADKLDSLFSHKQDLESMMRQLEVDIEEVWLWEMFLVLIFLGLIFSCLAEVWNVWARYIGQIYSYLHFIIWCRKAI